MEKAIKHAQINIEINNSDFLHKNKLNAYGKLVLIGNSKLITD